MWRVAYRVWDAQLLEFADGLAYVPLLDVFGGLDLETTARRKAFRRRPATALGTLKGHRLRHRSLRCNTGEALEPMLCWRRLEPKGPAK